MHIARLIKIIIIFTFVFAVGCSNMADDKLNLDQKKENKGGLVIRLTTAQIKTITPDMNITAYDITGIGPGIAGFSMINITSDSVSITDIACGAWSIAVNAKNAAGDVVGAGTANSNITPGITTNAVVTVRPLTDNGTLLVSLAWPQGLVGNPSISATLTPLEQSPLVLSFQMGTDSLSASYSDSTFEPGYYLLQLKLKDGTSTVWSIVQAVRISSGFITTAQFPLTASDIQSGSMDLQINQDMQNPIIITLSGDQKDLPTNGSMTVNATTSEIVDSYQWYLDGEALEGETGSSITIYNSDISVKSWHRLDVIARKDNRLGSEGFQFFAGNLSILTVSLNDVRAGKEFPATELIALGGYGNYIYSISSGNLPDGLTLSPDGIISGMVSEDAMLGLQTFTVKVADSARIENSAEKELSIRVVKSSWTILYHASFDNNLDYQIPDYLPSAITALEAIKAADANDDIEILVLMDSYDSEPTYTSPYHDGIYRLTGNAETDLSESIINTGEIDSGSIEISKTFMDWAVDNYPGLNYFYSLSNHGGNLDGISYDTHPADNMTIAELYEVTEYLQQIIGHKIDLFYPYACLMSSVEVTYELKDNVRYIIASEDLMWVVLHSYEALQSLITNPEITPLDLGKSFIDSYYNFFKSENMDLTFSLNDLSMLDSLYDTVNSYALSAISEIDSSQAIAVQFNNAATDVYSMYFDGTYIYDKDYFYKDFGNYLDNITANQSISAGVIAAVQQARNAYSNSVAYHKNTIGDIYTDRTVPTGMSILHPVWGGYSANIEGFYKTNLLFGANEWANYLSKMWQSEILNSPQPDIYEDDNPFHTTPPSIILDETQNHTLDIINNIYGDIDYITFDLSQIQLNSTIVLETGPGSMPSDLRLSICDYSQSNPASCNILDSTPVYPADPSYPMIRWTYTDQNITKLLIQVRSHPYSKKRYGDYIITVKQKNNYIFATMIGGSSADFPHDIYQTSDQGYIIAAESRSTDIPGVVNNGAVDAYVIKLNSTGAVEWQKMFGADGMDTANAIQQTADGGYIIAANSSATDIQGIVNGVYNSCDYLIIKLDSGGNTVWQETYGGSGDERVKSIHQTVDGGYIIAGYSNSTDIAGMTNHGNYDFYIIKTDNSGNVEWQKMIGGYGEDLACSLQETSDGGYIIAGHYNIYFHYIMKLNSSGESQWEMTYNEVGILYSIKQTSDGGYIAAGINNIDIPGFTFKGIYDAYIVKTDSSGIIEWQRMYGGTGYDDAQSVQQTNDGGYIIAGTMSSNEIPNFGRSDYYIIKLTSNGDVEWKNIYGGKDIDKATSIQQTSDGNFIVAGYSSSTNIPGIQYHGNGDILVLKLDSTGNW